MIKRGTHARVACMDRALAAFLRLVSSLHDEQPPPPDEPTSANGFCQVVVLGSGKDTTYFRLKEGLLITPPAMAVDAASRIRWYDVDHDPVIRVRATVIEREPIFRSRVLRHGDHCYECVPRTTTGPGDLESQYYMVSFDLRGDVAHLQATLTERGFESTAPTLFVCECLQMYLPEASTRPMLQGLARMAPDRAFLALYEPILGQDSFGQVMESNLLAAQVVQRDSCLLRTRTLEQQLANLSVAGFSHVTGCDLWAAYENVLSPEQRRHANACEFLDELEELILIMRHYCLIAASNSSELGRRFCAIGSSSPLGFPVDRSKAVSS